ncbi:immunity 22 family protein [Paenibacillus sp. Marseille-Q7038]
MDRLRVVSYSDEGDFISSIFAKHFEIRRYDDAVREAEYYEEASNDLNQLLEGFSYDEIVEATIHSKYLRFLGTVEYH